MDMIIWIVYDDFEKFRLKFLRCVSCDVKFLDIYVVFCNKFIYILVMGGERYCQFQLSDLFKKSIVIWLRFEYRLFDLGVSLVFYLLEYSLLISYFLIKL